MTMIVMIVILMMMTMIIIPGVYVIFTASHYTVLYKRTNLKIQVVPVISEVYLHVHASGDDRRQRLSEPRHRDDVVTGVRVRPRDIQIRDIHRCLNGHGLITLIDLTGDKISIHSIQLTKTIRTAN